MINNFIKIKDVVLSLAVWGAFISLTFILWLVMSFLAIVLFSFDKQRRIAHAQCYWWASTIIRLNPYWKVRVTGLENIDHRQSYVVVANHQSVADIIVLYKARMQFKWVAKDSLFRVPLIGWCLRIAKHIELERGNYSSIKKTYREAEQWLRQNMSVLFFPEGTRSTTDQIGEFQNGAFKLAIKEKKAILPIVIDGTRDAIPKGDWLYRTRVRGTLQILKPIDTTSFQLGEFENLKNIVRFQFEERVRKPSYN